MHELRRRVDFEELHITSDIMFTPEPISRVTRSREEAKRNYDRLSRWYDTLAASEKKHKEKGLQKLNVKEGETVLEIGFGTGQYIVALAHLVGDSGKVYGIDISEGMVDIALSRVVRAQLSERVDLITGDSMNLPFERNFFDAVLLNFVLELFDTPEIPIILDECKRVLRPQGRICVVALSKKGGGTMVHLYEWVHRLFPQYVDCRPIYVQNVLEDAGFHIVDAATESMWGLPVEIVLAKK
jgi:ubiquinone/menaquinone biosynthesis C-methylase UbiE